MIAAKGRKPAMKKKYQQYIRIKTQTANEIQTQTSPKQGFKIDESEEEPEKQKFTMTDCRHNLPSCRKNDD